LWYKETEKGGRNKENERRGREREMKEGNKKNGGNEMLRKGMKQINKAKSAEERRREKKDQK
jgi:hypothetical protein